MNLPLQLSSLRTEFGRARLEAERLTSDLSEAQLWQKPSDGGWSVGECLAHVNLAGEPYLQKMREALTAVKGKERRAEGPFRFGFLGGRFIRALSAESKGKFKAPTVWQPDAEPDVLGRFTQLQDDLLELTREADGLDLTRIKLSSPLSPLIRLSLFESLNLIAVHEDRHLKQASRVRQTLA